MTRVFLEALRGPSGNEGRVSGGTSRHVDRRPACLRRHFEAAPATGESDRTARWPFASVSGAEARSDLRHGAPKAAAPIEGRYMSGGLGEGTSDLVCMLSIGVTFLGRSMLIARWFVLEVKTPWGYTNDRRLKKQREFIQLVRAKGGFGDFVESKEEARIALTCARRGESGLPYLHEMWSK